MTRLEQLQSLLNADPEDVFLQYALAKEFETLGQKEEAVMLLEQLLEKSPTYVGAYYHLGKLLEENGQIQNALNTYQKGITMCQLQGDQHALSELQGAKMNLEMENL